MTEISGENPLIGVFVGKVNELVGEFKTHGSVKALQRDITDLFDRVHREGLGDEWNHILRSSDAVELDNDAGKPLFGY